MTDTKLTSQFGNLESFVPTEPKAMTPVMKRLEDAFKDTRSSSAPSVALRTGKGMKG